MVCVKTQWRGQQSRCKQWRTQLICGQINTQENGQMSNAGGRRSKHMNLQQLEGRCHLHLVCYIRISGHVAMYSIIAV